MVRIYDNVEVIAPINIAELILTYPADGVIATRPIIAEPHTPEIVFACPVIKSQNIQAIIEAEVANNVVAIAIIVMLDTLKAEPALKPNQPNQSIPKPSTVYGKLCLLFCIKGAVRGFSTIANAKPENPALTCTTTPPAKSKAPNLSAIPCDFHIQ